MSSDVLVGAPARAAGPNRSSAFASSTAAEPTPTLLTDLVVGGIHNHVIATPPALRPERESQMYAYAEQLVDAALRGVQSR